VDEQAIGGVLRSPAHHTHLAEQDGSPAGFVDAFVTISPDGQPRFEIDLLAVHPGFRRQGIGRRLVEASLAAACCRGYALARALIKAGNAASQGVFAGCGFQPVEPAYDLYISREPYTERTEADGLRLVQVETINYAGFWMENNFEPGGFLAARHALAGAHLGLVGALLPAGLDGCAQAAAQAGFELAGRYYWWQFNFAS
jgi:GNAT superfamily N-acetyltransferase